MGRETFIQSLPLQTVSGREEERCSSHRKVGPGHEFQGVSLRLPDGAPGKMRGEGRAGHRESVRGLMNGTV